MRDEFEFSQLMQKFVRADFLSGDGKADYKKILKRASAVPSKLRVAFDHIKFFTPFDLF